MTPSATRARCPGCRSVLRIPGQWVGRTLRCKRCGTTAQAMPKARVPTLATTTPIPVMPTAATPGSVPAMNGGHVLTAIDDGFALSPPNAPFSEPTDLAFDVNAPVTPARYRRPPSRGMNKWLSGVAVAGLIAFAGGAGYVFEGFLHNARDESKIDGDEGKGTDLSITAKPDSTKTNDLPQHSGAFPRRMLAISVNQYLYANPTAFGTSGRSVADLLDRMTQKSTLSIPKDQVFLLSDGARGGRARAPTKAAVETSIERFLAGSRAMDRVILLFAGQAVEVDDHPYLVPLEGELTRKETLIPLQWVFDKLAECPARQKVFVIDVCRYDSSRGLERPNGGPMGDKTDAMLKAPPKGVQVWTACTAKQYSYEFDSAADETGDVAGGAFIGLMFSAFAQGNAIPKPEDPLPLALLAERVGKRTTKLVDRLEKAQQTPRLTGNEVAGGAAYDPTAPPPAKFEVPATANAGSGAPASPSLIRGIVAEVALPPIKLLGRDETAFAGKLESVFPFSAAALKDYTADYSSLIDLKKDAAKYPLRAATIEAIEILRRHGDNKVKIGEGFKTVASLRSDFRGTVNDAFKKTVATEQREGPALILVELEDAVKALEKAGDKRDDEKSKRWQANYDYVLAHMKARLAYVDEYNLMLAKIRKDELPPLDPKLGHTGWRLASQEKLQSGKEVKDLANDSKKLLAKVIKEHPGTPWEVLAKRERLTALGLVWQPTNFGKE